MKLFLDHLHEIGKSGLTELYYAVPVIEILQMAAI